MAQQRRSLSEAVTTDLSRHPDDAGILNPAGDLICRLIGWLSFSLQKLEAMIKAGSQKFAATEPAQTFINKPVKLVLMTNFNNPIVKFDATLATFFF